MKSTLLTIAALTAVLAFAAVGSAAVVTGSVSKIDEKGSFYFVKDSTGKEHKLHFDKTTQRTGQIAPGAKVEINEEKGHAKSIKVVDADKAPTEETK